MSAVTEFGPFEVVNCTAPTGNASSLGADGCALNERKTSWNDQSHLLIVDQPVGTGFSYAETIDLVNDTTQAAADLWQGLKNLYSIGKFNVTDSNYVDGGCNMSQYIGNDFHIWGEEYPIIP